jgi:hypothetical protein
MKKKKMAGEFFQQTHLHENNKSSQVTTLESATQKQNQSIRKKKTRGVTLPLGNSNVMRKKQKMNTKKKKNMMLMMAVFLQQPQVVTKTLESATQKHNQHIVIRKKKKKKIRATLR